MRQLTLLGLTQQSEMKLGLFKYKSSDFSLQWVRLGLVTMKFPMEWDFCGGTVSLRGHNDTSPANIRKTEN